MNARRSRQFGEAEFFGCFEGDRFWDLRTPQNEEVVPSREELFERGVVDDCLAGAESPAFEAEAGDDEFAGVGGEGCVVAGEFVVDCDFDGSPVDFIHEAIDWRFHGVAVARESIGAR